MKRSELSLYISVLLCFFCFFILFSCNKEDGVSGGGTPITAEIQHTYGTINAVSADGTITEHPLHVMFGEGYTESKAIGNFEAGKTTFVAGDQIFIGCNPKEGSDWYYAVLTYDGSNWTSDTTILGKDLLDSETTNAFYAPGYYLKNRQYLTYKDKFSVINNEFIGSIKQALVWNDEGNLEVYFWNGNDNEHEVKRSACLRVNVIKSYYSSSTSTFQKGVNVTLRIKSAYFRTNGWWDYNVPFALEHEEYTKNDSCSTITDSLGNAFFFMNWRAFGKEELVVACNGKKNALATSDVSETSRSYALGINIYGTTFSETGVILYSKTTDYCYWSTHNMGAGNVLGNGNYYSFGDVEPGNFAGSSYSSDTYQNSHSSGVSLLNIVSSYSNMQLKTNYNAPYQKWVIDSRHWRIPTQLDMENLINRCISKNTMSVVTINGQKFVKILGDPDSDYASNYILLPMIGVKKDGVVTDNGVCAYFRVNNTNDTAKIGKAQDMKFYLSSNGSLIGEEHETEKYVGIPIRPVLHSGSATLKPEQGE